MNQWITFRYMDNRKKHRTTNDFNETLDYLTQTINEMYLSAH